MPTYEYRCHNCGQRFELFQRIADPPVKRCPKCRRNGKVERLISGGSGLVFKGSGFYATDYRRGPKRSSSDNQAGPTKSEPATAESKPGS